NRLLSAGAGDQRDRRRPDLRRALRPAAGAHAVVVRPLRDALVLLAAGAEGASVRRRTGPGVPAACGAHASSSATCRSVSPTAGSVVTSSVRAPVAVRDAAHDAHASPCAS